MYETMNWYSYLTYLDILYDTFNTNQKKHSNYCSCIRRKRQCTCVYQYSIPDNCTRGKQNNKFFDSIFTFILYTSLCTVHQQWTAIITKWIETKNKSCSLMLYKSSVCWEGSNEHRKLLRKYNKKPTYYEL